MSYHKSPAHHVDWNNPELDSLLRKTESWTLDNRSNHQPQHVEIFIGWAGTVGRPAVLVWQRDKVMVLETQFPLRTTEQVRVSRCIGKDQRTIWAIVADSREGFREEDREHGVYVHWLHAR